MSASRRIDRVGAALLCAVLILLSGAGAAWAAPLDDARRLLGQGRPADAQGVVSAYLQANPGDRDGRFLLANILAAQGQLKAAYAIFDELIAQVPDDAVAAAVRRLFEERGKSAEEAIRVATLFGEAQKAVRAKRWDAAIRALSEAVGLAPGNVAARVNLAQVLGEAGRYADAVPHLEEAIRRSPGDLELVRRVAGLYERTERPQDAVAAYERVLKARPRDQDALFSLARLEVFSAKDNAAALALLDRLLKLDSRNVEGLYLLGVVRVAMEQTRAAQESFTRALALDPSFYRAHFELGKMYEAQGRDAEALRAFENTVRYGGNSAEAEQARRRLAVFGTSPEVVRQVREGLDAGVKALDAGDLESAERILQGVLALVPGNPLAFYNLATIYTRQGRNDLAIETLKKALKSDPTHFPSHYGLALIYVGAGRFEDAYEEYRQVVRWAPPDNPMYAEAQSRVDAVERILSTFAAKKDARQAFLKGNDLAGQGDLEGALAQFNLAIELDDQNPFYYYNAGVLDVELEHFGEGFDAFKKAVALKPDHVQSHFRLGLFYTLTGFPQQAIDEFRAVIRYGTTEPEVAEARKRITKSLKDADSKEKALSYLVIANALDAVDRREEALAAIREARVRTPNNRGVQLRLMELLMKLRKVEEARELALPILEEHPDDAQFLYYLGQVEARLGHQDAAFEALRKGIEASPDNVDIALFLGRELEGAKRGNEAADVLRAVLARKPDHLRLLLELGRMLVRLKRQAEAATLYDWYLSTHDETSELLLERGLVAMALGGAAAVSTPAQADTALVGIVTGVEGAATRPKYATPTEWFNRAVAVAGPKDQRFAEAARQQLEGSRRLRLALAQTVFDYNTNANNSATAPLTGMSSNLTFQAVYNAYRSEHLNLPVTIRTAHSLHYTFQTYVNTNTASAQAPFRSTYLQLTPDVTVSRVRTQRGTASQSYAAGTSVAVQVPFPDQLSGGYRRTEFTSFTNATNNYLEERTNLDVAQSLALATVRLTGRVGYSHRVRNAVAASLDTERTEYTYSLGAARNLANQRGVGGTLFGAISDDVRTSNRLPTDPTKIVPIESRALGGSASFSFRVYPNVTGTLTGTYSVTDFLHGLFQAFPDPAGGDTPVILETQQRQTSLSYGLRLTYRPDAKTTWALDIRQLEARAAVDVPASVQDILTDQVVQDNINARQTATLSMTYSF